MHLTIKRAELIKYWKDAAVWIPTIAYAIGQDPIVLKTMFEALINRASSAQINSENGPILSIEIDG